MPFVASMRAVSASGNPRNCTRRLPDRRAIAANASVIVVVAPDLEHPHRADDDDARAETACEEREQIERRVVGPVQVVEQDHDWPLRGGRRQQGAAPPRSVRTGPRPPGSTSIATRPTSNSVTSSDAFGTSSLTARSGASQGHSPGAAPPSSARPTPSARRARSQPPRTRRRAGSCRCRVRPR